MKLNSEIVDLVDVSIDRRDAMVTLSPKSINMANPVKDNGTVCFVEGEGRSISAAGKSRMSEEYASTYKVALIQADTWREFGVRKSDVVKNLQKKKYSLAHDEALKVAGFIYDLITETE